MCINPGRHRFCHVSVSISHSKREPCIEHLSDTDSAGAAGNFLVPLVHLSTNAFKSVIDIDLMGSWNTAKTTMPHLLNSAAKYPGAGKQPYNHSSQLD